MSVGVDSYDADPVKSKPSRIFSGQIALRGSARTANGLGISGFSPPLHLVVTKLADDASKHIIH
jgi:hypothetical protein